jgi:hypothetical protein
MFGQERPWFIDQAVSVTVFCPWSNREVTVQYLTHPGLPPTLIGCDEKRCSMACLGEAPPPGAPGDGAEGPPTPAPPARSRQEE